MGLAASQARLLTITARLADNELRSQTINNAKMRLAAQSSRASEDYVNALNNARLMFTNIDSNGISQTQVLNFNNLTAYSPYNNQYGLINSAGLALVSENDAKIYENSGGNLNNFLEAHGLEWETTYFDEKQDEYGNELNDIQTKLTSFYGTGSTTTSDGETLWDIGYLYETGMDLDADGKITNADFKRLYEEYDMNNLSIEAADYINMSQEYYTQLKQLYNTAIDLFRKDVIGTKTEDDIIQSIMDKCTNASAIKSELKYLTYGSDLQLGLGAISQYLNDNGKENVVRLVDSLTDRGGGAGFAISSIPVDTSTPGEISFAGIKITGSGSSYTINATNDSTTTYYYNNSSTFPATAVGTLESIISNIYYDEKIPDSKDSSGYSTTRKYYQYDSASGKVNIMSFGDSSEDAYKLFLQTYFNLFLDTTAYFNPIEYAEKNRNNPGLADFTAIHDKFQAIYGIDVQQNYALLTDFDKLMQSYVYDSDGNYDLAGKLGTDAFQNVVKAYKVDKMVEVLGEPKYTWVDANDKTNTGNAEAKAQWYTNLFNRMQKGYKVLEDGLASSSKWLEYAFESGLVSMEQVDKSYNWNAISYNTCSNITEETDSSEAVAVAEAKYKRAMNDIQQKDKMYDLQLKNIDTEHTSLQNEYDSIKSVIKSNIERTMKFDQSA